MNIRMAEVYITASLFIFDLLCSRKKFAITRFFDNRFLFQNIFNIKMLCLKLLKQKYIYKIRIVMSLTIGTITFGKQCGRSLLRLESKSYGVSIFQLELSFGTSALSNITKNIYFGKSLISRKNTSFHNLIIFKSQQICLLDLSGFGPRPYYTVLGPRPS